MAKREERYTLYRPVNLQLHLEVTNTFFFKMPFVAMIPVLSGPLSLLLPDSAPAAPTNKEGGLCKQLVKLLHAHNSYRNTQLSIGFFTS